MIYIGIQGLRDENMKKKILLVHNFYQQPGGEDTVFKNESELLRSHGHEVVLYTRSNLEIRQSSVVKKVLLPFTAIFSIKTYREVKKIIRTEGIDIVHVHNTLTVVSPSVFYAAFRCKIPVVQTLHNFRMLCPNGLFYRDDHICEDCVESSLRCSIKHKCYRNSSMQSLVSAIVLRVHRMLGTYRKINFICLTEFNKEKLLLLNRKKPYIDEDKIFIKPNFIFPSQFSDDERIEKKKQYLYAGRLEEVKGIRLLLENWKAEYEAKLLICGSGPDEEWCRKYIKEHQLNNVEMQGQVSRDWLMCLIQESKAVIFPSLCYESFPMMILESYACGTKVLSTMIGNAAGIINELNQAGTMNPEYLPDGNYEILNEIYETAIACFQI